MEFIRAVCLFLVVVAVAKLLLSFGARLGLNVHLHDRRLVVTLALRFRRRCWWGCGLDGDRARRAGRRGVGLSREGVWSCGRCRGAATKENAIQPRVPKGDWWNRHIQAP